MSDIGVRIICDYIRDNPKKLKVLNLTHNRITEEGFRMLILALESANTHLETLDFRNNIEF